MANPSKELRIKAYMVDLVVLKKSYETAQTVDDLINTTESMLKVLKKLKKLGAVA